MSIVVQPKTIVALSDFLKTYGLTLMVRETGASKWEASFEPDVLEDTGEDEEGAVLTPITILGESTLKAVQGMCEFLSGHDGLSIDDNKRRPIELDLAYTKVECDYEEAPTVDSDSESDSDSGIPSVLKSIRRHHGGGE